MGHVPVFAAIKPCSLERTCSSNDFCKFVADSSVLWSRSFWKYEQRKLSKLKWPLQFGTFQGQWTKNRNKKNKLPTAGRQTKCLCASEAEEFIISEVFYRASLKIFEIALPGLHLIHWLTNLTPHPGPIKHEAIFRARFPAIGAGSMNLFTLWLVHLTACVSATLPERETTASNH